MNIEALVQEKFANLGERKKEISFKGKIGNFDFSSYLYIKPNTKKLYVFLNGAILKEPRNPFIYHRYSWHDYFDGSALYISDPTLFKYEKLNLAWYMGDSNQLLYPILSKFIEAVVKQLDIEINHTILYGSSGGGFAALQLASQISNGVVVVCINPQTDIMKYTPRDRDEFLENCFKNISNDEIKAKYKKYFSAIESIKGKNIKIIFVQNIQDGFHYKWHMLPLLSEFYLDINSVSNQLEKQRDDITIKVMIYDHASGHGAEPKEMLPDIILEIDNLINKND